MDKRMENIWTRCVKSIGVSAAVARVASRSLRRERRRVEISDEGGGMLLSAWLRFEEGRAAGGFEVASFEALVGRDANAASRSLE
jgi:hypothetical protein